MPKKSNSLKKDLDMPSDYLKNLTKKSNISSKEENLWNAKDVINYAERKIGIELDQWQKDYINTEGNVCVRAGRQSGKSFAQSLRIALFALLNPNTQTLIIGAVDRQSVELFEKVKSHIQVLGKHMVVGRPTMHKMALKNKSKIIALPAGRTGYGLRNYTIHKLVVDEAHYVPEEVYTAVRPMLATTGGSMDLLSTPRGSSGFFYECFKDKDFNKFHTTSEECGRIDKDFLKGEKRRMTKLQYAQEYLAVFLDNLQTFFPEKLITNCTRPSSQNPFSFSLGREYYLGIDIARYGGDENSFVIVELNGDNLICVSVETTERVSIADTIKKIQHLNDQWKFTKIYIDDGGMGGAVFDVMIEDFEMKRKLIGINNASRSINADKSKGKKLLKEDLYGNLKRLMEQRLISLPEDMDLKRSLMSIQFEYPEEENARQNVKIYGKYSHITEGLIRACWCVKTKGLKLYVY